MTLVSVDDSLTFLGKSEWLRKDEVMRQTFYSSFRSCNNVTSAALRAVGNIVTGDDTQTQVVLSCNALPALYQLLNAEKDTIVKETCWTISNIAAGNMQQIQAIIDANIFPLLINILRTAEYKTRKEAAWAVTNSTSGGTAEQIKYLVSVGCIPPMCELLTVMDANIVQVALNGLENILKSGELSFQKPNPYAVLIEECYGESHLRMALMVASCFLCKLSGLDKIEFLQTHEKTEIYERAYAILQEYYGNDDEEDAGVAPSTQNNEFQFTNQPVDSNSGFNF